MFNFQHSSHLLQSAMWDIPATRRRRPLVPQASPARKETAIAAQRRGAHDLRKVSGGRLTPFLPWLVLLYGTGVPQVLAKPQVVNLIVKVDNGVDQFAITSISAAKTPVPRHPRARPGRVGAVNSKSKQDTFMKMISAGAGLGVGVKDYRVIFVFETEQALAKFFDPGWAGETQGDAAAKTSKSGAACSGPAMVAPEVWVYQITKKGLALQLALQGTRYSINKDLNP